MELSSPRFKAFTVSAGFTFWFFIIISALGFFSIEILSVFIVTVFIVFQILARTVSKVLDVFAIYNTKVLLGLLFLCVISIYGIFFKILKFDLMRLQNQDDTYWLEFEKPRLNSSFKQY